ncbi:MAG: pyrroloquinoline quinone biosynthesis protein PqqF [Pseudomonas sp.]|uniref:pyrroloquinoline quinone biosynthesis protein PqqF n=1 Tax=Pseudomonas sp. TaxID=306 RepID=UPI003982871C
MEPVRRRLQSGLPVMLFSQPWRSHAGLCLRVNAGSHDEPLEYPGLAHFLEHLLFLGSAGFAGEQRLMPFVQACAGQVNATTQARYTEYFCEVPADYLDGALARLLDMLARPTLDEVEQVREREVLHAEFLARSQDANTLLGVALGHALAEGHRCAVFHAGNRDTLPVEEPAFQEALRAFHQAFYHAGNCQLSIVAPQSVEHLYALAQRHGRVLPAGGATLRELPAPMLPLRSGHLRLNLPGELGSLHLGFALELPEASADRALAWLQSWLLDERPGGLRAGLRERGLGEALQVQLQYCYAGQALLLLSVRGVAEPAQVVALLIDWLAFVSAHASPAAWLDSYQQAQQYRLQGMTPLALVRAWQSPEPGDAEAINTLLRQMQAPLRRCVLTVVDGELADWPGVGFALRMTCAPALVLPALRGCWQLPGANPLLAQTPALAARLAVPADLLWLPAPKLEVTQANPIAVWHARCCFVEAIGAALLLRLAELSLGEVRQHMAQLGISLSLDAETASLHLRLQGSASLLPRAIALLVPALLQPDAAHWRTVAAGVTNERQPMPIRQLLANSGELFQSQPMGTCQLDSLTLQQRYCQVRVEALGVGLDECGQTHIEALFDSLRPLQPSAAVASVTSGQHWRTLAAPGESALLLFCPQPDNAASTEACWRVLGQLHQGAFYQRLRSELQLGYAVFCAYRQIQGRRGLLFGVQSPSCNSAVIVEHIRAFLEARSAWLGELDTVALGHTVEALCSQWQLQARSSEGLAEQHWQAHLAGLPEAHAEAVQQALQQLPLDALRQAQQALNQAAGGWYVLSNEACSNCP